MSTNYDVVKMVIVEEDVLHHNILGHDELEEFLPSWRPLRACYQPENEHLVWIPNLLPMVPLLKADLKKLSFEKILKWVKAQSRVAWGKNSMEERAKDVLDFVSNFGEKAIKMIEKYGDDTLDEQHYLEIL